MKRPLKIAIFSGSIPSTTFIEHLIDGIAKQHHVLLFGVLKHHKHYGSNSITIYKTPHSHLVNLLYTIYRIVLLLFKRPKDLMLLITEIKSYPKLYERWIWFSKFLPIILYRPDVLHLQWARDLEYYTFFKTKLGIKLVVSLRGAHINYTPIVQSEVDLIYKYTFPIVDAFHAVSEAIAKEALLYSANQNQITIIHSPLKAELFERYIPFVKRPSQRFRIGSVGRFHWIKGMRYAIDACAILKSIGFNFEYTCISSNALTEADLFQIHQLQLENDIQVFGQLSQDNLFETMKDFDVLLLSSLNEGIANVVLEAMALGIPVISSDCGGMAEVVIPNETGWLVPIRDADAIAKAIIEVSNTSESDLRILTQQAHDFVNTHFNTPNSIAKFLTLYEAVHQN